MRIFASGMLMIGGVLSAFATPSAGQGVFADSVEPRIVEAGRNTSARCNAEDIAVYGPQLPSTSERPYPAHTREAGETARARAYLIATATPGYTMMRPPRCVMARSGSGPSSAARILLPAPARGGLPTSGEPRSAAAKARGKRLGRQPGQRPSDRKATKVLKLAEGGLSYRLIGRHVELSKNTVGAILQRARAV